nr:MAG TPA: hypothetical protein [Caudoviricetes sp.]
MIYDHLAYVLHHHLHVSISLHSKQRWLFF